MSNGEQRVLLEERIRAIRSSGKLERLEGTAGEVQAASGGEFLDELGGGLPAGKQSPVDRGGTKIIATAKQSCAEAVLAVGRMELARHLLRNGLGDPGLCQRSPVINLSAKPLAQGCANWSEK